MDKATAILINRHRLTESSLIVHWCSQELGLFKTVAKGALRPQSVFAGRLDLFVTCEVVFLHNPKSDLHSLKEVHLTQPRLQLRSSYARVLAGTYFSKLVELVVERETPLDGIHDLLKLSLDYLDTHDPTPRLVHRFENKLCEELGLGAVTAGAAGLLHETFHRPLPLQRAQLFETLAAVHGADAASIPHDFT
ncbi:MAG: DNA repair protein RecO [Verrucomicrobium sp.]|nr:DNA repair protein RecO [Verrucomicrobium sp.]